MFRKILEKFGIFNKSFDSASKGEREKFEKDWEMFNQAIKTSEEVLENPKEKPLENFERKIGEKFSYNGITLEIVPYKSCASCFFCGTKTCISITCNSMERPDRLNVQYVTDKATYKGRKLDSGKLRYTLLPFKALTEVVKVLEFGANKYEVDNWQKVPNAKARYLDAAFRHLIDYLEGKKVDEESNLPTLAHAVCDLLFVLWFDLTGKGE